MNLSAMKMISFEMSGHCNLAKKHPRCPVSLRKYVSKNRLTNEDILRVMDEAKALGFAGHFNFNYYNEPLMDLKRILSIISERKEKYVLWTNGFLPDSRIEQNTFLSLFNQVVITCYDKKKLAFFQELKNKYGNIEIIDELMDNRLMVYESQLENPFGCRRPLLELPIDSHGDIHLCCVDWMCTCSIGNVTSNSLSDIINGMAYQKVIKAVCRPFLNSGNCPDICKKCVSCCPFNRVDHIRGVFQGSC